MSRALFAPATECGSLLPPWIVQACLRGPFCGGKPPQSRAAASRRNPALLLFSIFLAARAFALDIPPQPTNWFTDTANVVNASDAEALNAKLKSFEQQSGVRFIVYVFPSLEGQEPADFTIRCAEAWKVWRAKEDKGLILTVFVQEHKIRVEVSYALEPTITDAVSSDIIRNTIAPHFRQNDYAGGLNAGIDALGAKLGIAPSGAQQPQTSRQPRARNGGNFDVGWLVVVAFVFFFFILPLITRRRSGCGGCFWPMFFLGGGPGITLGGRGGGWGGGGWGGGGGGGFGGGGFGGGGSFGGGGATGGW